MKNRKKDGIVHK